MKTIKLTQEKVALVDDELYGYLVCLGDWFFDGRYARINFRGQNLYMHRLILRNDNPKLEVDHKNENKLDNQIENLRLVTSSQNKHNRKININKTSGYRGVSLHSQVGRWACKFTINGKLKCFGLFVNVHDAARKYNEVGPYVIGEGFIPNEIKEI